MLVMVCIDSVAASMLCQMQVTYSTLIMVCIDNQQLEEAGQVHRLSIQAGLHPDAYAYNALINAYGCGLQVGVPSSARLG